ncbi:NUDIX domain-containing protein [Paenibacillus antri]|uniref:NUDIX domain-containing protein n=1 Tax=Paenibacillus antri TaxID=2582848 RepID=A0A5R9FWU1_9BACL|nr:NUDIX domain-containing protein [Paenibacillus antri]TLS48457.1 NUDIX domain-containing protein [Paenibacillus antri]
MTKIDKLAWIRLERGRVLCVRSIGKDLYYLPGGKRDAGETDAEALCREIEEELSVRLKPETIACFGAFEAQADGKAEGVTVKMCCYTADFDGRLSPASEIEEMAWLSYEERERVSLAGRIVFDSLRGKSWI